MTKKGKLLSIEEQIYEKKWNEASKKGRPENIKVTIHKKTERLEGGGVCVKFGFDPEFKKYVDEKEKNAKEADSRSDESPA